MLINPPFFLGGGCGKTRWFSLPTFQPGNQELSEERRHRDSAEASKRQAMSEVAQWQERYSTLQQQLGFDG